MAWRVPAHLPVKRRRVPSRERGALPRCCLSGRGIRQVRRSPAPVCRVRRPPCPTTLFLPNFVHRSVEHFLHAKIFSVDRFHCVGHLRFGFLYRVGNLPMAFVRPSSSCSQPFFNPSSITASNSQENTELDAHFSVECRSALHKLLRMTTMTLPSVNTMYRALTERDSAYDGVFFVRFAPQGDFCRPTCVAKKPQPQTWSSTLQSAMQYLRDIGPASGVARWSGQAAGVARCSF